MKRMIVHIAEKQDRALREFSKNNGYSVAEVVRRAIDTFFKEEARQGYYDMGTVNQQQTRHEEDR